jgi:hypothetical protein
MPSRIERDENLELKEKHTISLAVLDMKRLKMRYNIIVANLHVLLCFCLLKHSSFQASFLGANEKRVLSHPGYS